MRLSSIVIDDRSISIVLLKRGIFPVKNLTICGGEIGETVAEIDVILLKISRSDSVVFRVFFIELIFVIGFVGAVLLISKHDVIDANIFGSDGFLFSFNVVIGELVLELGLVGSIIEIVFVTDTKVVFTGVVVWLW